MNKSTPTDADLFEETLREIEALPKSKLREAFQIVDRLQHPLPHGAIAIIHRKHNIPRWDVVDAIELKLALDRLPERRSEIEFAVFVNGKSTRWARLKVENLIREKEQLAAQKKERRQALSTRVPTKPVSEVITNAVNTIESHLHPTKAAPPARTTSARPRRRSKKA